MRSLILIPLLLALSLLAASCAPADETVKPPADAAQPIQATVALAQPTAPVYTPTPTRTASLTPSPTPSLTPSATLTRSATPTSTPTLTVTPSDTPTATATASPAPTRPLMTLTPFRVMGAPNALASAVAPFTTPEGWSCGDFPCADDIDGFTQRIQVPPGYALDFIGRYPGQPQQITLGPDGRVYATLLLDGTREGAVYAMDPATGKSARYDEAGFTAPFGLAFRPGTDELYVSGRLALLEGGGLWRVGPDGSTTSVLDDLPCCFSVLSGQPNGLTFGPDGYLYLGVGALTDHLEPPNPERMRYAELHPYEAAVLKIDPLRAEVVAVVAQGIRDPMDLAFAPLGTLYVSDNGLLEGPGDRILRVAAAGAASSVHFGWPYWRARGCADCPLIDASLDIQPDLLRFPDYTLPRGLLVYTGGLFPRELYGSLFVALWHNAEFGQRVVRINPVTLPSDPEALAAYTPEPFITGLLRPADLAQDADGSLLIADFIYGHLWRVRYTGDGIPTATPADANALFATSTPAP